MDLPVLFLIWMYLFLSTRDLPLASGLEFSFAVDVRWSTLSRIYKITGKSLQICLSEQCLYLHLNFEMLGKQPITCLRHNLPPCSNMCELFVLFQYEDIVQLEWMSTLIEDSSSGGKENPSMNKKEMSYNRYQSSSPVSVLESSSSSSSCSSRGKTLPLVPINHATQRARTKRPRPKSFNPRALIQPFVTSQPEGFEESTPVKKTKKIKFTMPAYQIETPLNPQPQSIRKCLHCEITKTPQWRAGPMGPKTTMQCTVVRHKSGRLFPEYRPAASPTFVPSLHSNSHKKVVEMRSKADPRNAPTAAPVSVNPE
ncbi:GATA transcription factor 8-like [Dorcoceras hygrometricum]|uniref:GATA transcription factor 8-like n=1 Tax=Dorcoceras hygrometricum TaxID=472368 RepID=A0A2Z7BS12_9LAMI|nr:GATA transcription factor 8-like [Dorcoceras hygrometricum]